MSDIKVMISMEASKALHELTPERGPWVSTDAQAVEVAIPHETLTLLMMYQRPGDSIDHTIIKLCRTFKHMREVR